MIRWCVNSGGCWHVFLHRVTMYEEITFVVVTQYYINCRELNRIPNQPDNLTLVRIMSLSLVTDSMMTSSNGNIFRVTGPLCGEFTGPSEVPTQRPVSRSFDVFFDLRLSGWWFETPSWSLWRQCNVTLSCHRCSIHSFYMHNYTLSTCKLMTLSE